VRLDSMLEAIE